jgi:parallel beta-helix repeat protein
MGVFISCGGDGGNSGEKAGHMIQIPSDQPTIQAGIDSASDGDLILIPPGLYYENLNLNGKSITLASWFYENGQEEYIEETVIDGGGGQAVIEVGAHADGSKVVGLTIRNGDDGISVSSKINILKNRIINNIDGVDYEKGGGTCSNNLFADNSDDGIDLDGPTEATITNNIIKDNDDDGIEIRLHDYSGPVLNIEINGNQITSNKEDGIQLIDYPGLSDRVFRVERNVFKDNAMAAIGFMADGNTVEDFSGAPIPERLYLINNTFVGNSYGVTGGANLIVLNNIFADTQNTALRKVTGDSIASYNLLWNNGTDQEESNIDFVNTLLADPLLDSDYSLTASSPAIDAGTAFFEWQGDVVLDMSETSYLGSAPDMGAYETK